MKFTAEICQVCNQNQVPWTIENLASSLIWQTPEFKALGGTKVLLHACCYGSLYKKPTVFLTCGCDLSQLGCECPGEPKHPKHPYLTGKVWCPTSKRMMFRTKLEQVYSARLCETYAKCCRVLWSQAPQAGT